MLSAINSILTKAYVANCSFASFNIFRSALTKYGKISENDNIFSVRDSLKQKSAGESHSDRAFRYVLIRDIDRIISSADAILDHIVNESSLMETRDKYIDLLKQLSLDITPPNFFVVDKFPPPFDNNEWSAFCPDSEDEQNYGIKKGMYFHKKHIRPYYSEILLAHEIIHALCGQNNPELFAMGLEEGLAELLGSIYLASQVLGLTVARNNFVYTKLNKNGSLLWSLYTDHTRQAYLLYKKYGIEAIRHLISKGRMEIHKVEREIFSGCPLSLSFSTKTCFEKNIDCLLDYLMLGYSPNYIVTPMQMILIENAISGTSIKDISNITEIPEKIAKDELSSIAYTTSLFMLDGNKIGYSNVELYQTTTENSFIPILRYYGEI